jgi:putative DNA primase/helicase
VQFNDTSNVAAESTDATRPHPVVVAGNYIGRGWAPIPLRARTKIPIIDEWEKLRITKPELPEYFRADANIGNLLGEPSGWLVDVDLDHPLALELADSFLPATQSEFGRASARRSHRLFIVTGPVETHQRRLPKVDGKAPMIVELRSTGSQTMFPNSVHPEGEHVEWDSDGEPTETPPGLLLAAVDALAAEVKKRLGSARRNGSPSDCPVQLPADIGDRAKKYLTKIPPAVSGAGGHDQTFHAACVLVQGFSLERETALSLLREWNQTCQPPWSERELTHKIDSALKQPGERGYLIGDDRPSGRIAAERRKKKRTWRADAERAEGARNDQFVPKPSTDLGNGERFVAQHAKRVRYVATWDKWIIWDDARWRIDTTREVWRLAKKTVRSVYKEVAKLANQPNADADEIEELSAWAKASERRERIAAMLALAANEQGVAIDHSVLDCDPWLLNCANGTVDLRTGELRAHDPADLLTKSTGVEYPNEPGVDTPVWDEFLESTFLANIGLIKFLQRLIGYAAAGIIREHVLAILWGTGSNGKSTLLNAILDALGDYGFQAPQGFLMVKRGETHPTELTDLFGARFVSVAETEEGQRLNEGLVKVLTGGERIRARRMREDFWEFAPTHTPFMATNNKPVVRGGDYGIWRRLKLIPFTQRFVDPAEADEHPSAPLKDRELPAKLRQEQGGILRWIVEGCLAWQREGLNPPNVVKVATRAYKDESDIFKNWLADRCEVDPQAEWKASAAYKAYREWCDESGERPVSRNKFAEKVEAAGFERLPHRRDGNYYAGFRPLN